VSWLAGWKDSINTKDWKCVSVPVSLFLSLRLLPVLTTSCRFFRYVQLGATSTIKGESDQRKYEKARAWGLMLASRETDAVAF
jgi:DNA topoisomerase-1